MFVEDIPFTIFNELYWVYACFNAVAGGKEEAVGKGKQSIFIFATFFSVATGVMKFVELRGLKADKRNDESWIEIVKHRLVEANALSLEIKGLELGAVVSRRLYDAVSTEIIELKKENAQLKAVSA